MYWYWDVEFLRSVGIIQYFFRFSFFFSTAKEIALPFLSSVFSRQLAKLARGKVYSLKQIVRQRLKEFATPVGLKRYKLIIDFYVFEMKDVSCFCFKYVVCMNLYIKNLA